MPLAITLVVHHLESGAVARAHALSLALEHLGHAPRTVSLHGREVWNPLRRTAYGERCAVLDEEQLSVLVAQGTDLLVAVKPLPGSLGTARALARRHGVPLLVDIDDPDVEVYSTWLPPRELAHLARTDPRRLARTLKMGWFARQLPRTVSNPWLQAMYGGVLLPHPRQDGGEGSPHTTDRPVVAFVGSLRGHKGVPLLREAVARLAPEGWSLVVTHEAPPDARPWERWTGSAVVGHPLMLASDVVVIPSEPLGYGPAQLPMKLLDAMIAARAVVVSDVGPLSWAAGPAAPVFRSGDVDHLVEVLRPLRDPARRTAAGAALRAEALCRYTPEVLAPAVERALEAALRGAPRSAPLASLPPWPGALRAPRRPRLEAPSALP